MHERKRKRHTLNTKRFTGFTDASETICRVFLSADGGRING